MNYINIVIFLFGFMWSTHTPIEAEKVQWLSFEEAIELQKKNPKKIVIDMYTDWCGWCKVMDKNTFSNPVIAKYLNEHFYPVKFDGEQKEDIVFDGHTFKYVASGRRGYHELAASLTNGKMSYPTIVFLDENMKIITLLPGYKDAQGFEPIMEFVGGEEYKTSDWPTFQQKHKSSL